MNDHTGAEMGETLLPLLPVPASASPLCLTLAGELGELDVVDVLVQQRPDGGPQLTETREAGRQRQGSEAEESLPSTWNSVVVRMWRPSGAQQACVKPAKPSSILQVQSASATLQTCTRRWPS